MVVLAEILLMPWVRLEKRAKILTPCLDEVAQTVRGMLWVFRSWRTSGYRMILSVDCIFANRSGFRARLLVLKNERVTEELSDWELEEAPGLDWCSL